VAEIESYRDPPKTLEELQDAVGDLPKPGYRRHHIVEQTPAENDGFPRSEIDNPRNLVAVPTQKHQEISDWYSTKIRDDRFRGRTPREYLRGQDWDMRYEFGLEVLRKFGVLE
jgi:hypothetical protein